MDRREEMFFFPGSAGRRLLGFLHHPGGTARKAGILYCHPFAEEKNMSHAAAVKTARDLSDQGYPVLRFDYSGCGDSEGELDEVGMDIWAEDIALARACLREKSGCDATALWGLRSGANLALSAAVDPAAEKPAFLILWQPLNDPKLFMKQFLRQKLATAIAAGSESTVSVQSLEDQLAKGETLEVMGYPITQRLHRTFAAGAPTAPTGVPTLFATLGAGEAAPPPLANLAAKFAANGTPVDARHIRAEPFWDRYWRWDVPEIRAATRDWAAALN